MYTAHLEDGERLAWENQGTEVRATVTQDMELWVWHTHFWWQICCAILALMPFSFLLGPLILHLPVRASQQCFLSSMGRSFQAKSPASLHSDSGTLCFLLEIFFLGCLWSPVTPLKQQLWFFKAGGQEAWWLGLFPGNLVLAPPSLPSSKSVHTLN